MRQPAKTIDQVEKEIEQEGKGVDKRTLPKELVVERVPNGLYCVVYTSGGEVPDALKGRWTSIARAQTAIDNYKATPKQEQ